jgi:hypothetical protein
VSIARRLIEPGLDAVLAGYDISVQKRMLLKAEMVRQGIL